MKRFFVLLLLLFAMPVVWAQTDTNQQTTGARIRLHEVHHNFGDVARRGGDLVYELHYKNEGDQPLVLTRVVTSCSCLKAHFQHRPLKAGDEGIIRIVYEPQKSEPGAFSKVIQIYSNSSSGRVIFTVQGNALEGERVKVKGDKVKIKN